MRAKSSRLLTRRITSTSTSSRCRLCVAAATPADAALMMQLGVDGVFVGSGIFKSGDPAKRAAAIVKATTHYNDPAILAEASRNLGEAMVGINVSSLPDTDRMAGRGW